MNLIVITIMCVKYLLAMVVIEMKGSYSNALTDIYPNHLEVYVLDIVIQITIICMYLLIAQLGSFIAWLGC